MGLDVTAISNRAPKADVVITRVQNLKFLCWPFFSDYTLRLIPKDYLNIYSK